MKYKKGTDIIADRDFKETGAYGKVKAGNEFLFWKEILNWNYVPFNEIERVYRRVEDVSSRTGCCSNDFSVHTLVMVKKDGSIIEAKIGEGLYRHEPEKLIEEIRDMHPEILIGKE